MWGIYSMRWGFNLLTIENRFWNSSDIFTESNKVLLADLIFSELLELALDSTSLGLKQLSLEYQKCNFSCLENSIGYHYNKYQVIQDRNHRVMATVEIWKPWYDGEHIIKHVFLVVFKLVLCSFIFLFNPHQVGLLESLIRWGDQMAWSIVLFFTTCFE